MTSTSDRFTVLSVSALAVPREHGSDVRAHRCEMESMRARRRCGGLFRSRDPGLLHDLAPAHGLRLDEILQPFDRPVFKGKHAEPENLSLDLRQRENIEELAMELCDDVARRPSWCDQHVPARQCPELG